MQTRLILLCSKFLILSRTLLVENAGHVTLESSSALLRLLFAWGQKPQFAVHLPALYVIRYAVVGSASSLPSKSPRTIAVPNETRICCGKSAFAQVRFFANCYTEWKQCVKWYISLELIDSENEHKSKMDYFCVFVAIFFLRFKNRYAVATVMIDVTATAADRTIGKGAISK